MKHTLQNTPDKAYSAGKKLSDINL